MNKTLIVVVALIASFSAQADEIRDSELCRHGVAFLYDRDFADVVTTAIEESRSIYLRTKGKPYKYVCQVQRQGNSRQMQIGPNTAYFTELPDSLFLEERFDDGSVDQKLYPVTR